MRGKLTEFLARKIFARQREGSRRMPLKRHSVTYQQDANRLRSFLHKLFPSGVRTKKSGISSGSVNGDDVC